MTVTDYIENVVEMLDGYGLVITDYDLLAERIIDLDLASPDIGIVER